MQISKGYPPNIEEIEKRFTINPSVVFTYGDMLYAPNYNTVPDHLIAHEEVHSLQQGKDPEGWWQKYFDDTEFRIIQEALAYSAQYEFFKTLNRDRNAQARFRHSCAVALCGPVYGNCLNYVDALERIPK